MRFFCLKMVEFILYLYYNRKQFYQGDYMEYNNNFTFEDVTEEDIIKGAIESGIAVFLHGRSSEGKSARIEQLDPDCEIIYLRNATPDSLNGKSVYNSVIGEMIDVKPTWLVKLEAKCEAEPNKIHIVFFDEITNALHAIQGMAFNIIFNREVNGKWKLPDNARVVAAGNELSDSVVANTLAEPLFNRFAHVYIETTLDKWLVWAKTPRTTYQKLEYEKIEYPSIPIHPAIYAFIAYKACSDVDVLRTKYDGIKPNADPRKWEMASKMLYKTGNPKMLRSLVGEGIATEFAHFCAIKVPTVEDIIHDNYTTDAYHCSLDKAYLTVISLSNVDEENLRVVRNFVKKMGQEMVNLFDGFWISSHPNHAKALVEIVKTELSWSSKL